MIRHTGKIEAFQGSRADIVELRQKGGIDQVPAKHISPGVIDHLLGNLQARFAQGHRAFIPAPQKLHLVALCLRRKGWQNDLEQMMALNDIRIALPDDFVQTPQRLRGRPGIRGIDRQDLGKSGFIADGNGQERVAVGMNPAGFRGGFHGDLQTAQLLKGKVVKKGPPAGKQVLLDGIAE